MKTITLGVQKGGCSKTTTSGVFIYELAKQGKKVLAVDMDSQGNLTELLTGITANSFADKSVLEAVQSNDIEPYIYEVSENIDLLPANNLLAMLPRHLYSTFGFNSNAIYTALKQLLQQVTDKYDYAIIDTPPSLSEHTLNALVASDYVVIMYECSQWCYSAIPNFIDSVDVAKKLNPELQIAGIVRTLNDSRRNDNKAFIELIADEYPDLVIPSIIRRKATVGRLPIFGLTDSNPELEDALAEYNDVFKEVMDRAN